MTLRILPIALLCLSGGFLQSSCSFSLWGFGWGEEVAEQEQEKSGKSGKNGNKGSGPSGENLEGEIDIDIDHQVSIENMELKQARIWSRLDEIEGMLLRQKEKIKILEQGLLLGIKPKDQVSQGKNVDRRDEHPNQAMLRPTVKSLGIFKEAGESSSERPGEDTDKKDEEHIKEVYHARLMRARDFFREGKYGKAYLDFSRMAKEFQDNVHHGEPGYWIGRCWYQLKEYQQASAYLDAFIKKYTSSPHLPSARFYLAKTELAMGMREKAIENLKGLINDHPYDGSAEAAKQLLSHMTRDL